MIRAGGIAYGALSDDSQFDNPLGKSTGTGQLFGASGGVMEAMPRPASHFLREESATPWNGTNCEVWRRDLKSG